MQNTFEQISTILNNLEEVLTNNSIPQIEKDIVLEKLRNLYLLVHNGKTTTIANPEPVEEQKYDTQPGLAEDVDLFFDTDHDSYEQQTNQEEEEAKRRAEEEEQRRKAEEERLRREAEERQRLEEEAKRRAEEEQRRKAEEERLKREAEERQRQEEETKRRAEEEQRRKAEEERLRKEAEERQRLEEEAKRRSEEEQRRKAEEERLRKEAAAQLPSDEDDLLQFIPKNTQPVEPVKPMNAPAAKPTYQTTQRSLNDLFNEQREDNSLSAQFQRAKVTDLTKAISINDKFTYIKELFNNKGEEFGAAINRLNQCQNMDEAFDCLEGLKQKFFWDSTSTAYLSLCDLLRRKFN